MAGGSSGNCGQSGKGLFDIVFRMAHIESIFVKLDFRADGADPASVGVYDTAANGNARIEAHLSCCLFTQSSDKLTSSQVASVLSPVSTSSLRWRCRTNHFVDTSHALEVVLA